MLVPATAEDLKVGGKIVVNNETEDCSSDNLPRLHSFNVSSQKKFYSISANMLQNLKLVFFSLFYEYQVETALISYGVLLDFGL